MQSFSNLAARWNHLESFKNRSTITRDSDIIEHCLGTWINKTSLRWFYCGAKAKNHRLFVNSQDMLTHVFGLLTLPPFPSWLPHYPFPLGNKPDVIFKAVVLCSESCTWFSVWDMVYASLVLMSTTLFCPEHPNRLITCQLLLTLYMCSWFLCSLYPGQKVGTRSLGKSVEKTCSLFLFSLFIISSTSLEDSSPSIHS